MKASYIAVLVGLVLGSVVGQKKPIECDWCRKGRCIAHLPANRHLTPEEHRRMKAAIQVLLDRKYKPEKRAEAARVLGRIAHLEAIEPLKQIAFNRRENELVRYWAVTALSQIADKKVIPLLIDLTLDDKVGRRACEQLWKLTGLRLPPGIEPMKSGERWKDWWAGNQTKYHQAWKTWWEKNKDTFVFDRTRALIEY